MGGLHGLVVLITEKMAEVLEGSGVVFQPSVAQA